MLQKPFLIDPIIKTCQNLLILPFLSETTDVPAGCGGGDQKKELAGEQFTQ